MIKSGVYQLLIEVPSRMNIMIGNLGRIKFRPGFYIYTGSARNILPQRLGRHFKREKSNFWHIDYLLQQAEIMAYNFEPYALGLECRLNILTKEQYPQSRYIPGFGSSDCKCPSHLIYLGNSNKHLRSASV